MRCRHWQGSPNAFMRVDPTVTFPQPLQELCPDRGSKRCFWDNFGVLGKFLSFNCGAGGGGVVPSPPPARFGGSGWLLSFS